MRYLSVLFFLGITVSAFAQSALKYPTKVSIFISLKKDTVLSSNDLLIYFKMLNSTNKTQKVLIGHPAISTLNDWNTSAKISEKKSRRLLQYTNRYMMNSHISPEDELKDMLRNLPAGDSLVVTYKLTDIVAFFGTNGALSKGSYKLQLFYGDVASNKVKFYVTR